MRTALINPPSPFLINQRVFSNLGLLRVATHMKANKEKFELFDLNGYDNYEQIIANIATKFDVIGFSSTTSQFPEVNKMREIAKYVNPKIKTVIGGAHACAISSARDIGINDINTETIARFDMVIEGECEFEYDEMFKEGSKWRKTSMIWNIDETLIPDRNLIDTDSYKYQINGRKTTNILTQRGCPFKCEFCCGRDIEQYKRTRMHGPKRVLEEMDRLSDRGYKSFMWFDDEINLNTERLIELCKTLEKRDYTHRGFIRTDLMLRHPETLEAMINAGFVKLCAGIESGSDRILKVVNKQTNYETNLKVANMIKDRGIHFEAFMLVGLPSEKYEDIELTKKWLREAKPNDFDINIMQPYPGSHIYDYAIPSTKFKEFKFEYNGLYFNRPDFSKKGSYYKGIGGNSAAITRTDELTHDDLFKLRKEIDSRT